MSKFWQIFWPKKMRELVAKYEAKGTLNEDAIHHVSKRQYISLAVFVFVALIDPSPYLALSIVLALLTNFVLIRLAFFREIMPYTLGEKIHAKLNHLYFEKIYHNGWKLSYTYEANKKIFPGLSEKEKKELVINEEKILILVNRDNHSYNIPYIPSWSKKLCLDKDLIV